MKFDISFDNSDEDVDEENEDSENKDNEKFYTGREGMIFLIDCQNEMFDKDIHKSLYENEMDEDRFYSGFVFALECCKETMLNKIKLSQKSLISVIFFGVEKGDSNRKHVAELTPLTVPSAVKIKELDEIIRSESHNDFETKYGHSESGYLNDALCTSMFSFSTCPVKIGLKRILLFTKEDNPEAAFPNRQHQIRRRAIDISEAGIDLDIIPPVNSRFNPQLFYQEILRIVKKENYEIPLKFDDIRDAMDVINKENHNKRTISHVKFYLGDQVIIGIGVYGLICKKKRFIKKTELSRVTNEPVRSVWEFLDMETGDKLRPYQVMKSVRIGGKDIFFSYDELSKIKKVFEPRMTLLGFKPKNFWNIKYLCHQSYFIFPDESIVDGSRKLFVALLKRCVARDIVPICVLTMRKGSRPKYVLLIPQEEKLDEKNHQEISAGFHVYVLPFSRMFGDIPIEKTDIKSKVNELAIAKNVITKSKVKRFQQDFFENPVLSKLWVSLESVALQKANPKQFEDSTMIHHGLLRSRLGNLARKFNEIVLQKASSSGNKRKHTENSKSQSDIKIPKKLEFIGLATQRKIDKLTIAQLKEILKLVPRIRINVTKKKDLVELVYKNIDVIKKNYS